MTHRLAAQDVMVVVDVAAQFRIADMGLSGWMDASVKVVAQLCFTAFIALSG